jgi:hypothetical protein
VRGRAGRGRKSGPSTITIPVTATTSGAIAANQFTGWTHSSGTVYSRTAYGTTAKYFASSVTATVDIQSRATSRDQEVTFWTSSGRVYLRLNDTGRALRFYSAADSGGGWAVDFVTVATTGWDNDTFIASLGSGTPSGINMADTAGDEYTFGVSGVDVYVKWNGVEQWREKQIFCLKPGKIGLRCDPAGGTYGYRDVSATFAVSTAINSSPEFSILDVRDFGLKTLATTGDMTAGTSTLLLDSNPGFVIGDPIIIEVGGESGGGARGTRGVGGQWPALTYANAAARDADTSQVTNKICALISDGLTYRWNGSWWVRHTTTGYHDVMIPRALIATITNVSGTTITLDTAATVTTTAANVYFNNAPKYAEVLGAVYFLLDSYIPDFTISWPSGNFAWGVAATAVGFGSNRIRWSVSGQGVDNTQIFSPEGALSLQLEQSNWTGPSSVSGIEFLGNTRATAATHTFYNATTDAPEQGSPCSLRMNLSTDVDIYNVRTIDHYQSGIVLSACATSNVYNCEIQHTTGHRAYTQWGLNFANNTGCTATDVYINADFFIAGFEQFQCTGDTFTNITTRNAIGSMNSSGDWLYTGIVITLETGKCDQSYFDWHSSLSPVMNLNSNVNNSQGIPGQTDRGVFSDFTITQAADFRSGVVFSTFGISGTSNYVTILGQYPAKPNSLGLITTPSYSSGTSKAINDDSSTRIITIDGVRVITPNSGGPDIRLNSPNAIVRNCVADTISNAGTSTSNITNAAYNAL